MGLRSLVKRRLALVLIAGICFLSFLSAEPDSGRARIALFEPAGQKTDTTLAAVLSTVADSVELSLVVLERCDVRRLPPADPVRDLAKIRAYCDENRIDQAIIGSGQVRNLDFRNMMTWYLPHRSIKVDGKTDDWVDIVPVLRPELNDDTFPNQPGTQITKVFACRDDKTLYLRIDFSDGTPTGILSKDIADQLKYSMSVRVKDNNIINVDIGFDRRNGAWTALTIWNEVRRTWRHLMMPFLQNIEYRTGNGTLEIGVPFAPLAEYVSDGAHQMDVNAASADATGQWDKHAAGGTRMIYFVP